MTKVLLSGLLACLLSIGAVAADDREKSANTDATFKSLDRDADQRLSRMEAGEDKMLTEHFSAADADSDGYVSRREYTAHMKVMSDKPKRDY